jgi:hypothetical protein
MNVIDIIFGYLDDNGYDGLVDTTEGCGCGKDDLGLCCSEGILQCEPAYKLKYDKDSETCKNCESIDCSRNEDDGCYHIIKP